MNSAAAGMWAAPGAYEKVSVMNFSPLIIETIGAATAAAAGLTLWGAVHPAAQLFGPTLRTTGDAGSMALTFDDGPNPAATPALLDLLARYDARGTFFLIGRHVRAFPSLAREIVARGHGIGNHTETHANLFRLGPRRIAEELQHCAEAIATATGQRAAWMRPPFGFRGPQVQGAVRRAGCAGVVMWSAWARDWKVQEPARVIERLRQVRGGDIVLLHDGDHRVLESDRRHTVAALEYWLPRWRDAGLPLVTVDEIGAGWGGSPDG